MFCVAAGAASLSVTILFRCAKSLGSQALGKGKDFVIEIAVTRWLRLRYEVTAPSSPAATHVDPPPVLDVDS